MIADIRYITLALPAKVGHHLLQTSHFIKVHFVPENHTDAFPDID